MWHAILSVGHSHRFGNRVTDPLLKTTLAVIGTGPGPFQTELVQCSDSELAINFSAKVSGSYSLAVSCRTTGEVRLSLQPL